MRASVRVAQCEMLFTLLFNKLQYEAFTSRARSDSCREMISPPLSPVHAIYKKLPVLTLIVFQSWYTSLSYWFTRDSKRRRATSCLLKNITFYQTQVQSLPCLVNPSLNQSLPFFFLHLFQCPHRDTKNCTYWRRKTFNFQSGQAPKSCN